MNGSPERGGRSTGERPVPSPPEPSRAVRRLLALGLLVLAPFCAEYVTGYDDSTGRPALLLANLLVFAPLYGAPALLIREVARRCGMRWPGILALTTALGILQAGVIDQSMFSVSYRQIEYWDEIMLPTYIAPMGFSAFLAVTFVAGHAVWSFGIPIALVEALHPASAHRPWLRGPGLAVVSLLYLAAAALVLVDHLQTEVDHASPAQLAGSLAVAALLVVAAATWGRRPAPVQDRAVPPPLLVAVVTLVVVFGYALLPPTWAGTAAAVGMLAAAGLGVGSLSRSPRWGRRHVVALAAGALAALAASGFLIEPLGDVAPLAKYAHNTASVVGAVALGLWAARRGRERSSA